MTDTNYTPDEIRLLDEFAAVALPTLTWMVDAESMAIRSYTLATAMIAERRKRVQSKPVRDPLYPQPKCGICGKAFLPHEPMISDSGRFGVEHVSCSPERQPQPEQQPSGELTEDNINGWSESATVAPERGDYILGEWEIDRALALMREGLAAKDELAKVAKRENTGVALMDGIIADLRAQLTAAEKECDEARDTLAAAQTVLDAVVATFQGGCTIRYGYADDAILRQYADLRRNEAKQQGGAS